MTHPTATPEYKAVHTDNPDLPWQAQWLFPTNSNPHHYERGGYYATQEEALAGAKRGKQNQLQLEALLTFTPDTMQDGYEQALLDGMNKLHITHTIQTRIKATRELIPNLYMRLCYIAIACQKQKNFTILYDSILIFTETLENISQLHQINHTPIPRFYIKRTNAHGFIGYIWVDSQYVFQDSLIYATEAEAQQAIDFLKQEIAEAQQAIDLPEEEIAEIQAQFKKHSGTTWTQD